MPEREDCIYAAGFFDGEGCIQIGSVGRAGQPRPRQLMICAVQIVPTPILWLRERWGGSVVVLRHSKRPIFRWNAQGRGALAFLLDVRPWLQVKGAQADVAIAYQQTRRSAHNGTAIPEGEAAHGQLLELRRLAGGAA